MAQKLIRLGLTLIAVTVTLISVAAVTADTEIPATATIAAADGTTLEIDLPVNQRASHDWWATTPRITTPAQQISKVEGTLSISRSEGNSDEHERRIFTQYDTAQTVYTLDELPYPLVTPGVILKAAVRITYQDNTQIELEYESDPIPVVHLHHNEKVIWIEASQIVARETDFVKGIITFRMSNGEKYWREMTVYEKTHGIEDILRHPSPEKVTQ